MIGVEVSRTNNKRPAKYKPALKSKIPMKPKTVSQMEKKGTFLVQQFENLADISELIVDGHYTARAWSAIEVGERPPKTLFESQMLAQKGRRYLDRVFRLKKSK